MTGSVADLVEGWLAAHPGEHLLTEIARGVQVADQRVREALRNDGRFSARERLRNGRDNARVYFLSNVPADGPGRAKRPSQCDLISAVLRDGEWHTADEIHRRCGFSRLNSRVAELRRRGMSIVCEHVKGQGSGPAAYRYRLVGTSEADDATSSARAERTLPAAAPSDARMASRGAAFASSASDAPPANVQLALGEAA